MRRLAIVTALLAMVASCQPAPAAAQRGLHAVHGHGHHHARRHRGRQHRRAPAPGPDVATTRFLPGPLQDMLGQVERACSGFRVLATGCWRGGHSWRIMGSRQVSLHCSNRAADFRVSSWSCAYSVLRAAGWQGGLNRDAAAMQHVHLSWAPGSREWTGGNWARRFCHHGSPDPVCAARRRYASHHRRHRLART